MTPKLPTKEKLDLLAATLSKLLMLCTDGAPEITVVFRGNTYVITASEGSLCIHRPHECDPERVM